MAGCHLRDALCLFNGIDLDPLLLTLSGASSHLLNLFLRYSGPWNKFKWSHSASPPPCCRALCLGAAWMLQLGTSRGFLLLFLRTIFEAFLKEISTQWAILLLASSTYFTVNWNLNSIIQDQIEICSLQGWVLQDEPGQETSIFFLLAVCFFMVLAVASCSVRRTLSHEREVFSFISLGISYQPVASL